MQFQAPLHRSLNGCYLRTLYLLCFLQFAIHSCTGLAQEKQTEKSKLESRQALAAKKNQEAQEARKKAQLKRRNEIDRAVREAGGYLIGYPDGLRASFQGRVYSDKLSSLTEIAELKGLLFSTLTDIDLSQVVKLSQIVHLSISSNAQVTDDGIAKLTAMPQLESLEIGGQAITDNCMATIVKFQKLKSLSITNTRCSNTGLKLLRDAHLNDLSLEGLGFGNGALELLPTEGLQRLSINGTGIRDFSGLGALQQLKSLGLNTPYFSDRDINYLSNIRGLSELRLIKCNVSDGGISDLQSFANLNTFKLHVDSTTQACLNSVAKMSNLQNLELRGKQYDDKCLQVLPQCANLKNLTLSATSLTDNGLAFVTNCPSLEHLAINYPKRISDKGVKHLLNLPELKMLVLDGVQVSKEGVARLRRSLPNCDLHVEGKAL